MPIEPTPGSSEKRPQRHQMLAGEAPIWFDIFFQQQKPPFIQDFCVQRGFSHSKARFSSILFPAMPKPPFSWGFPNATLDDTGGYIYIYICIYIYIRFSDGWVGSFVF